MNRHQSASPYRPSMHPLAAALAQRPRDVAEAAKRHVVQPGDLYDDDRGILAVVGKTLHHRAEECLRQPGGAIQSLLDGERPRPLSAFDLVPELVEEHAASPGGAVSRFRWYARPGAGTSNVENSPS